MKFFCGQKHFLLFGFLLSTLLLIIVFLVCFSIKRQINFCKFFSKIELLESVFFSKFCWIFQSCKTGMRNEEVKKIVLILMQQRWNFFSFGEGHEFRQLAMNKLACVFARKNVILTQKNRGKTVGSSKAIVSLVFKRFFNTHFSLQYPQYFFLYSFKNI